MLSPLEEASGNCTHHLCSHPPGPNMVTRRLGNVVLILGGHVSNQKFCAENGTDLEEHPAAFAICLGWEAVGHHIYTPL